MFAALQASPDVSLETLVEVAQSFTPRFQVVGPFVLLDVGGLSSLFGSASELGASLRDARPDCRAIAIAPTVSAAMLMAAGCQGLTVVSPDETRAALAPLPVDVLVGVTEARVAEDEPSAVAASSVDRRGAQGSPAVAALSGDRRLGLPAVAPPGNDKRSAQGLPAVAAPGNDKRSAQGLPAVAAPGNDRRRAQGLPAVAALSEDRRGGGWRHPRDTHQAGQTRREPARVSAVSSARQRKPNRPPPNSPSRALAVTLRRWGIRTLGELAALPRPDVHERLGALGVSWQRLAIGEDEGPLVPWVAEPVFEETIELEWPVEGFEPLSFVLARLLEPLAVALERADRGAVAIRTALRLTTREVHVRVLPLPAPMRDPKTLRTLVLLDLESHPPAAAVDQVQVRLEPTPGRVLQWTLFERARPAPEQVATLLARLTAFMGEGRVGAPALVDSWRPGAFAMEAFGSEAGPAFARFIPPASDGEAGTVVAKAFRRFRLPVPVRVRVENGRPVRLTTDRHGVSGGAIVQAAGPWRTSGEWWGGELNEPGREWEEREDRYREREEHLRETGKGNSRDDATPESRDGATPGSRKPLQSRRDRPPWDRDEWDIAMADGTVYRLFVERSVGQWFLEGVVD